MLPRIRPIFKKVVGRRYISDGAVSYHPKVRAFPFVLSKAEAIRNLGPSAAFSVSNPYQLFSSLMARHFPNFGFSPFMPEQIQAVYLPGWFVDAEVQANAWIGSGDEVKQRTATAHFLHSYMPGCHYLPMSQMSFNNITGIHNLGHDIIQSEFPTTAPFSSFLLRQHGADVLPLPYTISPLSVPDFARSLSFREATVPDDGLRFDPPSLKTNLLAAYPILIPVYIARYEHSPAPGVLMKGTCILEAYITNGSVHYSDTSDYDQMPSSVGRNAPRLDNLAARLKSWAKQSSEEMNDGRPVPWRDATFASFAQVDKFLVPAHRPDLADNVQSWINDAMHREGPSKNLLGAGAVDMEDLRVRELTQEEVRANRRYMKGSISIGALKEKIELLSSHTGPDARVIRIGLNSGKLTKDSDLDAESKTVGPISFDRLPSDKMVNMLKSSLEILENEKEDMKPAWWKAWEDRSDS